MVAKAFIQCRVTSEEKARLQAAAARLQITETALMRRLLELYLATSADSNPVTRLPPPQLKDPRHLKVQLTIEDRRLLQERAEARRLPSSTYVACLVRAHLRAATPLPRTELEGIRQASRNLATVGRYLNALHARQNSEDRNGGLSPEHMVMLLKVCTALRDHFRAYVSKNLKCWEVTNEPQSPDG
jgi:hypothetical protein